MIRTDSAFHSRSVFVRSLVRLFAYLCACRSDVVTRTEPNSTIITIKSFQFYTPNSRQYEHCAHWGGLHVRLASHSAPLFNPAPSVRAFCHQVKFDRIWCGACERKTNCVSATNRKRVMQHNAYRFSGPHGVNTFATKVYSSHFLRWRVTLFFGAASERNDCVPTASKTYCVFVRRWDGQTKRSNAERGRNSIRN